MAIRHRLPQKAVNNAINKGIAIDYGQDQNPRDEYLPTERELIGKRKSWRRPIPEQPKWEEQPKASAPTKRDKVGKITLVRKGQLIVSEPQRPITSDLTPEQCAIANNWEAHRIEQGRL